MLIIVGSVFLLFLIIFGIVFGIKYSQYVAYKNAESYAVSSYNNNVGYINSVSTTSGYKPPTTSGIKPSTTFGGKF